MKTTDITDILGEGPKEFTVQIPRELLVHYRDAAKQKRTEINAIHRVQPIVKGLKVFCERFIPKQKNTAVSTTSEPEDYVGLDSTKFKADIHTHPMDSASPSGTDVECYTRWAAVCENYQLNIIISHTEVYCAMYLYRGLSYILVPIKVYTAETEDLKFIENYEKEYLEKVTKESYNEFTPSSSIYRLPRQQKIGIEYGTYADYYKQKQEEGYCGSENCSICTHTITKKYLICPDCASAIVGESEEEEVVPKTREICDICNAVSQKFRPIDLCASCFALEQDFVS